MSAAYIRAHAQMLDDCTGEASLIPRYAVNVIPGDQSIEVGAVEKNF